MEEMHFESRELKPYAEPVSGRDLKEGAIYFFVNFADEAMLLPTLKPVVFIGRDFEAHDAGVVYFQDLDSYQHGVRYDSAAKNEDAAIYCGSEDEMGHVFEYEHALEELMRCAVRRKRLK